MKVRIKGNSIRFRLKEPEVNSFGEAGIITESIQFAPGEMKMLKFTIEKYSGKEFKSVFENNEIKINVPDLIADQWMKTSQVSINEKILLKDDLTLTLLIEKDFACLDRSSDDNEGTYPNPLANCAPANGDHR
jgi:hypothetical protein